MHRPSLPRAGRAIIPAVLALACAACSPAAGSTGTGPAGAVPSSLPSGAATLPGDPSPSAPGAAAAVAVVPPSAPGAAASPPPASSGPLPGDLLIADRGNDRLLIVTPAKQVVWSMTIDPGGPGGSQSWGPDDAFFTPDGTHIIVNQENAHAIAVIDIATKKVVWRYGHTGSPGSRAGYLNGPDDAYMLPDGTVTVADIKNERILFISPDGKVVRQLGLSGNGHHHPPTSFTSPNGDVPLPDGGTLVTEIGGSWVDRIAASGALVSSVHLAGIAYPSDAQLLPNGDLLVVDYSTWGKVEEVTPTGTVVWRWAPTSGPGVLNHPSLAIRLANGNIAVTNDGLATIVVIDPTTSRVVWEYGHTGLPGTGPDQLWNPDGMDPVPPAAAALLATMPRPTSPSAP